MERDQEINDHYTKLRSEREAKLERLYGKRLTGKAASKVCIHTLAGLRCPNRGACTEIYLDHYHIREHAIIGEPYSLTKNELVEILAVCDKYNLGVDISAELSRHNIGGTILVAIKQGTGETWGFS